MLIYGENAKRIIDSITQNSDLLNDHIEIE
jgi:hypothetical protein